jgi:hypothetical protein
VIYFCIIQSIHATATIFVDEISFSISSFDVRFPPPPRFYCHLVRRLIRFAQVVSDISGWEGVWVFHGRVAKVHLAKAGLAGPSAPLFAPLGLLTNLERLNMSANDLEVMKSVDWIGLVWFG